MLQKIIKKVQISNNKPVSYVENKILNKSLQFIKYV